MWFSRRLQWSDCSEVFSAADSVSYNASSELSDFEREIFWTFFLIRFNLHTTELFWICRADLSFFLKYWKSEEDLHSEDLVCHCSVFEYHMTESDSDCKWVRWKDSAALYKNWSAA